MEGIMATTRRWLRPRALFTVLAGSALLVAACSSDPDNESGGTSSTRSSTTTESTTTTTKPTTTTTTTIAVDGNTSRGAKMVEPHRAIYKGGKLYLEGAVPSRKVGDALKKKASEVIGAENVIDNYVVDPAAPAVTDGKVVVDEPFLFRTGSAQIDPAYDSLLNLGAIVMQINPQVVMVVRGYTDDVGDDGSNLILSQQRAQAVANWIGAKGIPLNRFQVQGMGEADPIGDNATPEGKALNRRIEVELINLLA
jgi:outer membrane protein OmpA-like peptidoglycan-associated protein